MIEVLDLEPDENLSASLRIDSFLQNQASFLLGVNKSEKLIQFDIQIQEIVGETIMFRETQRVIWSNQLRSSIGAFFMSFVTKQEQTQQKKEIAVCSLHQLEDG